MTGPDWAPAETGRARSRRSGAIGWTLRTAPVLAVFWLVLSGHVEPLLLALGALSVAVVCWLAWRANLDQHLGMSARFALRLPLFSLWLGAKVLVSALVVARKAWSPRLVLRPVVAPTPAGDLPVLAQVVYANSITLTPGTLSLDIDDDRIEVHGLEPAGVEKLREGAMLRRVRQLGA